MEDKKLQKEDLSKVSGGVIIFNSDNGGKHYCVLAVHRNCDTVAGFAKTVIERGKEQFAGQWPQDFEGKLIESVEFINAFEKTQKGEYYIVDVFVNAAGNITYVSCEKTS